MTSRDEGPDESRLGVLLVCPNNPYKVTGGVETVVRELLHRLRTRGTAVTVVTFESRDSVCAGGDEGMVCLRSVEFPRLGLRIFSPRALLRLLVEHRNAILHVQAFHSMTSLVALLLARRESPLIFQPWYHGRSSEAVRGFLLLFYKVLFRIVRDKIDLFICASGQESSLLQRELDIPHGKVEVVPPGYEFERILAHRWKGSSGEERTRVLFVGRFVEHKNPRAVVQAISLDPELELIMVGEGPLKESLRDSVHELGLQDRVEFLGTVPLDRYDRLLGLYAESDVLVLPSTDEAFGIVPGEAALVGCPVVVAESQALAEYVENGIAIGLSLPITPEKILQGIRLATESPRERAMTALSDWDTISRKIAKVYQELSGPVTATASIPRK